MDDINAFEFDSNEEMEDVQEFNKLVDSVQRFGGVNVDAELGDPWLTTQQNERDKQVTKLLQQYVKTYIDKTNENSKYRKWILYACAAIIAVALFCCIFAIVKIAPMQDKKLGDIISLVTAYGGVIASTMSIVKIITKYIFPENEEQYITEIVKSIQANDLENKKVNIEASFKNANYFAED